MPTADGRFRGISVPSVPWLEKKTPAQRIAQRFFNGEVVCEQHPDKPFQHGGCPEPGMPPLSESRECEMCSVCGYCEDHDRT